MRWCSPDYMSFQSFVHALVCFVGNENICVYLSFLCVGLNVVFIIFSSSTLLPIFFSCHSLPHNHRSLLFNFRFFWKCSVVCRMRCTTKNACAWYLYALFTHSIDSHLRNLFVNRLLIHFSIYAIFQFSFLSFDYYYIFHIIFYFCPYFSLTHSPPPPNLCVCSPVAHFRILLLLFMFTCHICTEIFVHTDFVI